MKIRSLAIVCLAALLIVCCGITSFATASVYIVVNAQNRAPLDMVLSSRNSANRLGLIALGDPIDDPRPHQM